MRSLEPIVFRLVGVFEASDGFEGGMLWSSNGMVEMA
jgi:hypothetical protein